MPLSDQQRVWLQKLSTMAGTPMAGGSAMSAAVADDDGWDDDVTTSMHLPEPGEKPAVQKKLSPPKAAAKVIDFSKEDDVKPENVLAGPSTSDVTAAARNLSTRAELAALGLGTEVLNACLDFQKYATPKIKEMEKKKEQAADLAGTLATGLLGMVGGELVGKIVEGIGKKIAEKIADGLKEQIVSAAKAAIKDGTDLSAAIDKFAQGFRDWASGIKTSVGTHITTKTSEIEKAAKTGLSKEQIEFIEPVLGASDDEVDALIESKFGIPGPARAKEVHLKIYHMMVLKFEERHLEMTSDDDEKPYAFADAHTMADNETAKRSDDMHKKER